MTGADFLWFLEEIWFDLTHLDTADLPSLVFRIIVLVGVLFFGTFLLRVTVTVIGGLARSYTVPAFGSFRPADIPAAVPGRGHLYAPNPKSPIAAVRAGVDRDSGRIARLYYLTRIGAEQVAELWQTDPETVFYPKGDKLPLLDVLHRALTIDCWIELQRFAAANASEVEFFHPYFRTTGANRGSAERRTPLRKLTRIDFPPALAQKHKKPFFWPDAAFVLKTPKKRVFCLLEVYRGIDTGRVIRQPEWHLLALEHGLPSLKYGFTSANKVLVVFETEVALHAVLKRLLTRPGFEEFAPLVACSTLERLRKDFEDWWYVRGGEIRGGGLV